MINKIYQALIIQTNIKYTSREHRGFIGHHIALCENSLVKALLIESCEIGEYMPRFLSYSVNTSPSKSSKLLSVYLKMPLTWRLLGKQMFMVRVKP
jgi:hypothetical protein